MKPLLDCLDSALKRSRELLIPFQKYVWIKLFFLYLLAGSCSSFPGFGIPGGSDSKKDEPATIEMSADQGEGEQSKPEELEKLPENFKPVIGNWGERFKQKREWLVPLVIGLAIFGSLFLVFWIWLSSRISLVVVACLAATRVSVKEFWASTRDLGHSFFKFNLVLIWTPVLLLALVGYFVTLENLKSLQAIGVLGVILGSLSLIIGLFLIVIFLNLLHGFLPIVMYKKKLTALKALGQLGGFMKSQIKRAILVTAFYIFFSFAIVILFGIVGFILFLILFVPYGIMSAVIFYVMAKFAISGKLIAGIILGMIAFVLGFSGMVLYMVPLQTFLTYLRMDLVDNESTPKGIPS